MLPPFDWSHIVTKEDLVPVRADIDILKVDVRELKTDVNQLKVDVRELKTDVNQLKVDVSELRVEFGGLKKDFAQLTSDIDHRFTVFELRLESKIHKMLGDQIKWMVGTAIALNTLMLTGAIALSTFF
jgi:outer membrane murein-binding lipoprotein Lpp